MHVYIQRITLYPCIFSIPSLLPTIQERLLDCISMALSKNPYPQPKPGVPAARMNTLNITQQVSDISGPVLVQLALRTLAHFNFKVSFSIPLYLLDLKGLSLKRKAPFSGSRASGVCQRICRYLFGG